MVDIGDITLSTVKIEFFDIYSLIGKETLIKESHKMQFMQ